MRIAPCFASVAALTAAAGADVVVSTFDSSPEGWLVADASSLDSQLLTAPPDYHGTGGFTGGFVTTPPLWLRTAFFVAPAPFLGDQSDKFGGRIEVQRAFTEPRPMADPKQVDYAVDLTMTGAEGTLVLAIDLDPVVLGQWGHASVPLTAAGGWFHLVSGLPATDAEVLSALGDLEDLRVRGNIRDDFGRVGIDEFGLVPTPGGLPLLTIAGFAARRRRRSCING